MARLLLVEDDASSQLIVRELFATAHALTVVETAGEALGCAAATPPDLVLLDVRLPDGDGFHLFPKLRALPGMGTVPIIFLTGKTEVSDRVAGFAIGADDYVVKPFEALELQARVEAKLNQRARESKQNCARGDLNADQDRMRAFVTAAAAEPVDLDLTACEFKLLLHLLKNEGHVISRDQLMSVAWSQGVHVFDRTVDRHISSLKKKLMLSRSRIETVRGAGYRLVIASMGKELA